MSYEKYTTNGCKIMKINSKDCTVHYIHTHITEKHFEELCESATVTALCQELHEVVVRDNCVPGIAADVY